MSRLVVYVDVDDTLIRTVGSKRIPMPAVVRRVRDLHQQGAELWLWSSGGADYARSSAQELSIEHCFMGFLPKPHLVIDDQPITAWHTLAYENPLTA